MSGPFIYSHKNLDAEALHLEVVVAALQDPHSGTLSIVLVHIC